MNVYLAALRAMLRAPLVIASVGAVLLCAALSSAMPETASDVERNASGWERAAPALLFGLWAPALLLVSSMRSAWPFFGPGDEGLALVHTHARSPLRFRAWTCAAFLSAACCLQLVAGATLGGVLAVRDTPELRTSHTLLVEGKRFLARAGDTASFELGATGAGARLRLEPLSGFGSGSARISTDYVLQTPEGQGLPFTLRESGDHAILDIGARSSAGTWTIRRSSGAASCADDFVRGRVVLEDARTNTLVASLALVAARLPWAIGFACVALLLARCTARSVHLLAIMALGLMAICVPGDRVADTFARAGVPAIGETLRSIPQSSILIAAATLALSVVLPFSRPRAEAVE